MASNPTLHWLAERARTAPESHDARFARRNRRRIESDATTFHRPDTFRLERHQRCRRDSEDPHGHQPEARGVPAPSEGSRMRVVVTGANGSVGKNLLAHASQNGNVDIVAAVRSERAAAALPARRGVEVRVVSADDVDDLARTLAGASSLVHLSGILIESRTASYAQANVAATNTAVEACRRAGVPHIVLISALGADVRASNRYRRSKGEGERAVERSGLDATIIRTPILLGPDTAGAAGYRAIDNRRQGQSSRRRPVHDASARYRRLERSDPLGVPAPSSGSSHPRTGRSRADLLP